MNGGAQAYLGRIVAFAVTPDGRPAALYRVSSRSFPNRMAVVSDDGGRASILPAPGHEADAAGNPYVSYNCLRVAGGAAVLSNGSHTDPVAEKVAAGMPIRDAIALALLALDYEKDDYSTPRIAAAFRPGSRTGWLGCVRRDGLDVRSFALSAGSVIHLSTYGHDVPDPARVSEFPCGTADEACSFIMAGGVFAGFSHPVAAAAAVADGDGFSLAARNILPNAGRREMPCQMGTGGVR